MSRISEINTEDFDPRIADSEFLFASDVQNPLVGPEGALSVFGPQKGTTPAMVEMLDKALTSWADLVEVKTGIHLHDKAGAAGGIGVHFKPFSMRKQKGASILLWNLRN